MRAENPPAPTGVPGIVYLVHLDNPIRHAQHYLGWTETSLIGRLKEHRSGRGARLLRAAVQRGIGFEVVRIWTYVDRHWERTLKNRKEGPRLCPFCMRKKT